MKTTQIIDRFSFRFPFWDRHTAAEVLRETRAAARDLTQFVHVTGLTMDDALALWVSGENARAAA